MSRIRSINTAPEILVRSSLHRMGLRFRLHVQRLPGRPDVVLAKYQTAIFVHGCFWHQHVDCKNARVPKSNVHYWSQKLSNNRRRFEEQQEILARLGWKVRVIWECQTRDRESLEALLKTYFTSVPLQS